MTNEEIDDYKDNERKEETMKNLIFDDIARCNNSKCPIIKECARYQQYWLDQLSENKVMRLSTFVSNDINKCLIQLTDNEKENLKNFNNYLAGAGNEK